jgi:signal transduction histidine kinase
MEKKDWSWVDWMWLLFRMTAWLFNMGRLYYHPAEQLLPTGPVMTLYTIGFLVPQWFWRPGCYRARAFAWSDALLNGGVLIWITSQYHVDPSVQVILAMGIAGYFLIGRERWVALAVTTVLIHPIGGLMQMVPWGEAVTQAYNGGLAFAIGVFTRGMREKQELIEAQNQALVQHSKQVEQLTLLEERNRMARDLHDTVGHTFTSVIMGMDAVSYLIDAQPEKAKQRLEVLREITRSGLDEVRGYIHRLAEEEAMDSLLLHLRRVTEEFAEHTATRVTLAVSGEEADLPRQVKWTLLRCLQESLTNAKRHGGASAVQVTLRFDAEVTELRIQDNGSGAAEIVAGFGLQGMRERVTSVQGSLELQSSPGAGTAVICRIPTGRNGHASLAVGG